MCGICGFNYEDKNLLKKMCNLIEHRGPDDSGYFNDTNVSIGMRRLSVIDLNTGSQPQYNENKDKWIVSNGEIYNFIDLKVELEKKGHEFYTKSDTEVIIHAYEEWGENCVNHLRGDFAFCIYDSIRKIFFLARDHLGIKPIYYYFDGNRFIFSSEIKCIFCHPIKKSINREALNFYLSLKYVPFEFTLFENIKKLPSSCYLIFDLINHSYQIKKFWKFEFNINTEKDVTLLAKELKNKLEECVKIRLISDVPLGAFLSGGIDSTTIVGIMSKFIKDSVKTFSISFETGAPVNEAKYAKLVSEFYNTDHTEILVKSPSYYLLPKLIWHLDDLISDAAFIPTYIMSKYAKKRMTVALSGDGADEIFAGYSNYYQINKNSYLKYLPQRLLNTLMKSYKYIPSQTLRMGVSYIARTKTELDRFCKVISIPDEEKRFMVPFCSTNVQEIVKSKFMKKLDVINQIIDWDLNYQLPNQFNMKIDKMAMAASLEVRPPFLDYKLVEFTSTIPSYFKLYGKIEKYILRLAMKDLLPREILKRKKMGFTTPMNLWLRTGLKEVSGELLERLSKRQNLLNYQYVKTIKRHRFSKIYENRAWNLMMFELWYETFMENDGLKPINF